MATNNEAQLRMIVRAEVDAAMLQRVLPILAEQLAATEIRLREAFRTSPEPPPTRLRLVPRSPTYEERPEDVFWNMDCAEQELGR